MVLYFCPIESCSQVVEANQEQQQKQPQLAAISDAGAKNHSHLCSSSTVQLFCSSTVQVFLLHSSSSVNSLFLSALRLAVLKSATCCRQRCLALFFQYMRPAFCLALFPLLEVTFHLYSIIQRPFFLSFRLCLKAVFYDRKTLYP